MNFYPFEDIETIAPRPMLFITGNEAHSREFSEQAYQLATEPKQLVTIPGAGHVDLYDPTVLIPFDTLATFFQTNLDAGQGRLTDRGVDATSAEPGKPVAMESRSGHP